MGELILKTHPDFKNNADVIVLALPRGGVPIGFEIAKKLNVKFDLIVAHKLGAPGNPEFAIGAVAEDGSCYINQNETTFVSKDYLENEKKRQLKEIKQRIKKYRLGRPLPDLKGKTVILADDGIATGNTMKAAVCLAKNASSRSVIVAAPVMPEDTFLSLKKEAEVMCLDKPYPFIAIGRFYQNFNQLTDEEVAEYLK